MLPKSAINLFLILSLLQLSCCQISSQLEQDIMPDDDQALFKHAWTSLQPNLGFKHLFSGLHDFGNDESTQTDTSESATTERDREPLSGGKGLDFPDPKGIKPMEANIPINSELGIVDIPAGGSGVASVFGGGSNGGAFGKWPGNIFEIFGALPRQAPWWKGENVCTEKEEVIESNDDKEDSDAESLGFFGSINFSSCSQTPTKYECTTKTSTSEGVKTFIIKYKCCHGYYLKNNKCSQIEDLKSVTETCTKLSGKEFSVMITNTGLEKNIEAENVTVFMPTDDALKAFSEKLLEMNEVEMYVNGAQRRRRDAPKHPLSSRELVQSHIVEGLVELNDLSNDDVIRSEFDNSTIRINMYPTATRDILTTANCIPVTKKDQMAVNAMIHVLDGVMTPVTKTLTEVIADNNQLKTFNQIMEKINLDKFFEENKVYTIFAPSDAAFENLSPEVFEKLKKGSSCAENILKHHILNHFVCSNAINFNATTHNVEGTALRMKRGDNYSLIIENKAKVVDDNIMATNGIVHIIDTLLLPDSGLDASQLLIKHNLTAFETLLKESGLLDEINNRSNITLIVPTNEAINKSASELDEIKQDPAKLRELIQYHTVESEVKSCDFQNNGLLKSDLGNDKLRVNLYNTLPFFNSVYNKATINCARLINADEQACGAVIHEVNKVLIPPKESVLEAIRNNKNFSTFADLLNGTKLEEELAATNESFTVIVPTNEAFTQLPAKLLESFENDTEKSNEMLRLHVIPDVVCCSGVGYQTFPFTKKVPTLSAYTLTLGHDGQNRVRFADASVTKCDQIATNGIIHSVNKVIIPTKRQSNPFENLNFMLFNF